MEGDLVYIRVYHLTTCFNKLLKFFGLGMFHSSIEVYGDEYWYGYNSYGDSGISREIVGSIKLKLYQRICIGHTCLSRGQVYNEAYYLKDRWQAARYDLFSNNCNNFTQEFLRLLVGYMAFPKYINRASMLEPFLRPFINSAMAIYKFKEQS